MNYPVRIPVRLLCWYMVSVFPTISGTVPQLILLKRVSGYSGMMNLEGAFPTGPTKSMRRLFLRKQLAELLDSLKISAVYAMGGLSFGGPVTAGFVANYPGKVSKVILVHPYYPDAGPSEEKYPEFFCPLYDGSSTPTGWWRASSLI